MLIFQRKRRYNRCMGARVCERCGGQIFTFRQSTARFCGTRCRVAAHRERHKKAQVSHFPQEMLDRRRWVNHDENKRPICPLTGGMASSTDPMTWGTYQQARQRSSRIGFVLGEGIGCIDLDHAINEDGTLTEGAATIVAHYPGSYIEVSPSGRGLHIWGLAHEQRGFRREWHGQAVEFYSQGRYITVTGQIYQPGSLQTL